MWNLNETFLIYWGRQWHISDVDLCSVNCHCLWCMRYAFFLFFLEVGFLEKKGSAEKKEMKLPVIFVFIVELWRICMAIPCPRDVNLSN